MRGRSYGKLILSAVATAMLLVGCGAKEEKEAKEPAAETAETTETEETAETEEEAEDAEDAAEEAGAEEAEDAGEAALKDVLYSGKLLDNEVQFIFSDGTSADYELEYFTSVTGVEYYDMTGDGADEVVVEGLYDNTITAYEVLNVFQIEGKEVRRLFPSDDVEALQGKICEASVIEMEGEDRAGYGLHVKTHRAESVITLVEEELDIYFEDGVWMVSAGQIPDIEYEIVLDNVIYNGITYMDLWKCANAVAPESPYSADTWIKFILQSYPADGQTVLVEYTDFSNVSFDPDFPDGVDGEEWHYYEAEGVDFSLFGDDECLSSDDFKWRLTLMGKNQIMMHGCKSLVALLDGGNIMKPDATYLDDHFFVVRGSDVIKWKEWAASAKTEANNAEAEAVNAEAEADSAG